MQPALHMNSLYLMMARRKLSVWPLQAGECLRKICLNVTWENTFLWLMEKLAQKPNWMLLSWFLGVRLPLIRPECLVAIENHSQPTFSGWTCLFSDWISTAASAFVSAPLNKSLTKKSFFNFSATLGNLSSSSIGSWYNVLTDRNVAGVSLVVVFSFLRKWWVRFYTSLSSPMKELAGFVCSKLRCSYIILWYAIHNSLSLLSRFSSYLKRISAFSLEFPSQGILGSSLNVRVTEYFPLVSWLTVLS